LNTTTKSMQNIDNYTTSTTKSLISEYLSIHESAYNQTNSSENEIIDNISKTSTLFDHSTKISDVSHFYEQTSAATSTFVTKDDQSPVTATIPITYTIDQKPKVTTGKLTCPGTKDSMYPDPNDSKSFIICLSKQKMVFLVKCPNEDCYNPNKLTCDENYCQNKNKLECPGKFSGIYKDSKECSRYIMCDLVKNELFARHVYCIDGYHYNPSKQTCEPKEIAGCEKMETTQNYKCPQNVDGWHADPNNCSMYYVCENNQTLVSKMSCPDEYHYNALKQTCQAKEFAECQKNKPTQNYSCPQNVDGWHADPNDCSFYYVCEYNQTKVSKMPCPDGLHYSVEWKSCDYAQNAGCMKIPDFYEMQHFHDPCPNNQSGFFPDPYNCTHYYECKNMNSEKFSVNLHTCPHGQHFSPVSHACDLIEKASCVAQPHPLP